MRDSDMDVVDSRKQYCGHADIKLLMQELKTREPGEPLPAEVLKKFKDLKDSLLNASSYVPDPKPRHYAWQGGKLEPPIPVPTTKSSRLRRNAKAEPDAKLAGPMRDAAVHFPAVKS